MEVDRFWPDGEIRNLGIACGPSRLVVLDFDTPEAFYPWAAALPEAVHTYTVARDNAEPGRCHLYFALGPGQEPPRQLTKAATGWGDLKSVGGQVVAPPSVHYTGGRYTVTNEAVPLPWRVEYTPEPYAPGLPIQAAPFVSHVTSQPAGKAPGIPPSVQAHIDAGAVEGARNQTAFFCATQLRDEGHTEAATLELLRGFAGRCTPPFDEKELATTVASAFKAAPRTPAVGQNGPAFYGKECVNRQAESIRNTAQAATEPWPEPLPLGGTSDPCPPWPWESFPAPLADLGKAIAATMNVSDELPGLGLLCAVSIACRKVARIEIKRDHHQFANVYGLAALPVAGTKTPVARVIQRSLLQWQRAMREKHSVEMRQWAAAWTAAKAEIIRLEKCIARGDGNLVQLSAEIGKHQAVEHNKPCQPVLIANDCTSEAMARIMAHNGEYLGIFSSEARAVLAIAKGKYLQQGADIQVWLAGHGGDYLRYDRNAADKPPFEICEPVLSAFLATQRDSLQTMGHSMELRESGFLARWIYVLPDKPGSGEYPVDSIEPRILEAYNTIMTRLLDLGPALDENQQACPHNVCMDHRAFGYWKTFHDQTKREAMAAPPLLAGCLNKLPEHSARIALAFHLFETAAEKSDITRTLTPDAMRRALALGEVLKAHIKRAAAFMGDSDERNAARLLWPCLDANRAKLAAKREREGLGSIEAVKPRDVARYRWAGVETTTAAWAALAELALRGWVRAFTAPARAKAAPAHELFMLYPK